MNHCSVLFVCLGNICRSPTAHGVFQAMVDQAGLGDKIRVDSAGTAAWHVGKQPDERSMAFAARRGYDLSSLRARQVSTEDFMTFDYILAMDSENLANLKLVQPENTKAKLAMLLDYAELETGADRNVPDPYHGGDKGFDLVLDLIEQASTELLITIQSEMI